MSIECLGITRPARVIDKSCVPSLFKVMNRTKTTCGAQLLKANLLQPLIHLPTLNHRSHITLDVNEGCRDGQRCCSRYEAVKELKENEDLRSACADALESMPKDLDKICSVFTVHAMEAATMTGTHHPPHPSSRPIHSRGHSWEGIDDLSQNRCSDRWSYVGEGRAGISRPVNQNPRQRQVLSP